MELSPAAAL
jgi:hypothetical protein